MRNIVFSNNAASTNNKKALAWFIDFVLIMVSTVFTSILIIDINKTLPQYKECVSVVERQIETMNSLTREAKLSSFDEDNRQLSLEKMYREYAIGHIILSFNQNKELFISEGIDLTNSELIKNHDAITPEIDPLAYLYYYYIPRLDGDYNQPDYGGLTVEAYYKNILCSKNEDLSIFNMDKYYPVLKPNAAINLYDFIILEHKNDSDGAKNNAILADIFVTTHQYNCEVFSNLSFFQSEYLVYANSYQKLTAQINIDYIISFSISFIFIVLIPNLTFKNGRSIGKVLAGISIASYNEKKMNAIQNGCRLICDYVLHFGSLFITSFFVTGTNAIILPMFKIGNFGFNLISVILVIIILGVINCIISMIKRDKRSAVDLITNTISLVTNELSLYNVNPNKK